ncbi:leucine rich repeat family protein, partial [Vibrio parahaemolyticus V-223/04]
PLNPER